MSVIDTELMKFFLLILTLLSFVNCVPTTGPRNARRVVGGGIQITPKATPTVSGVNNGKPPIYWYNSSTISTTLFVNQSNKSVMYLRGNAVEAFLAANANYSKTFCFITSVNANGAKKQWRSRAVPFSIPTIDGSTPEWQIRVDISNYDGNSVVCSGTALTITNTDSAFQISDLCSGCSGTITAGRSYLFAASNAGLSTQIPDQEIDLTSIGIKVDTKSVNTNPTNQCVNSTCIAQGYDCCVSTQCAINGLAKPGASSEPDYAQSQIDIAQNYVNIKNYQHLYYVCPNLPLPTPTATATPDASATASADLALQKSYWECLSNASNCTPPLTQSSVQQIIWDQCGCKSATPSTDCANWSLTPIYDTSGTNIIRFECFTPAGPSNTPFTSLKVNVSARSAPHRFFKSTDGSAVDDLTSLFGTTTTNEGSQFSYLDETNKLNAQNVSLNMNAILGQMTVQLNRALPAKVIDVQPGISYIISANKGVVSLCTKCGADYWNSSLRAYPSSSYGSGLRAYGHSTTRDVVSTNITNGNYEDTLFGRACFIPPTMIPFSHQKSANVQTQRMNRLETQAAFYANGYRRDWFGFNLGALIGSFDGVQWFAIGQGRLVTSNTSTKLFLAINAPLADLTDASSVTVNILQSQGAGDTFTTFDWDFILPKTDGKQNQGASCQQYHSCTTDGDCITKLGWEYMCSDVTSQKSVWPTFTSHDENANDEESKVGTSYPFSGTNGSTKRCVYRGAGAPCKMNFLNLPTTMTKLFTCAPNFYCAGLNTSDFNQDIARDVQFFDSINFGHDADIPGRPKDYVTATSTLSATAISNMTYNFANQHANFTTDADYGLCRPGKKVDTDSPINQHQNKDTNFRTDYISQISGCDSATTDTVATFNRTRACPVLDSENNYTFLTLGTHSLPATRMQNLCGAESIDSNGISVFTTIEGTTLNLAPSLLSKTLAKDACFRRAGATCFTDLDCAPNKMHAEIASTFDSSSFGGNKAELTYWEEYLVCGQSETFPQLNATNFNTYDMSLNKCCRPLEKTVTISTGGNPEKVNTTNEDPSFDFSWDENKQSVLDPSAAGRYSRYTVVEGLGDNSPSPDPYYANPVVNMANLATATVPEEYQWMTIGKAAEMTCCGGGWVRKFAAGDHDWSKKNRLNIDYSNFKCINYINDNIVEKQNKTLQIVYDSEYSSFCTDPTDPAPLCWQMNLTSSTTFTISPPTDANTAGPQSMLTQQTGFTGNLYAPYAPSVPLSSCAIAAAPAVADTRGAGQFVSRVVADGVNQLACIYLPSYINGFANIRQVDILHDTFPYDGVIDSTDVGILQHSNAAPHPREFWEIDSTNGIFIWGDSTGPVADDLYVRIYFNAPQTEDYRIDGDNAASNVAVGNSDNPEALVPGNDLYYLNLLGRLELLGIPQITYPALYCNSNRSELVPGIFDVSTRTEFEAATVSFTDANIVDAVANANQKTTTNQKIALNDVFSSDEVVCCAYLGKSVDSISKCCSNSGKTDPNNSGKFLCTLPNGTDLNVYFNRFVSGDGIGSTQPQGGFINTDFDILTGEPNLDATVFAKLKAFGEKYCADNLTVTGGAFGNYSTTPTSAATTRYWGIVDESVDVQPTTTTTTTPTPVPNDPRGAAQFDSGFKWNHHIYCSPTPSST